MNVVDLAEVERGRAVRDPVEERHHRVSREITHLMNRIDVKIDTIWEKSMY